MGGVGLKVTEKDIRVFVKMYEDGNSCKQIADKTRFNIKTVNKTLKKNGIVFREQYKEELKRNGLKKCICCEKIKLIETDFKKTNDGKRIVSYCNECKLLKSREYRESNKEKINKSARDRRKHDPENIRDYQKNYYAANKDRKREQGKKLYNKNRKEVLEKRKQRHAERMENDVQYRLSRVIRSRLNTLIRKDTPNKKLGSAIGALGCSLDYLKKYLEEKFYFDKNSNQFLSWDNYGTVWHIDHIRPLASFNLSNEKEFLEAFHYTNLQPLSAIENISKGAKISEEFNNV